MAPIKKSKKDANSMYVWQHVGSRIGLSAAHDFPLVEVSICASRTMLDDCNSRIAG